MAVKTPRSFPDAAEATALAHRLADAAGDCIRQAFRQPLAVDLKSDASPVTAADRSAERIMRDMIERHRPDDGIVGEEFGEKKGRSGLTWVLDPIDGTKSFVVGRATFGTLIALCEDDVPVLGVIDQPVTRERWIGVRGAPTLFNGAPVQVRPCAKLADARAGSTSPAQLRRGTPPLWERLEKACAAFAWGGDCYLYGLLACGYVDMVVESLLKPHDFAALVPVVEGAGGIMRTWQGDPVTLGAGGDVVALSDNRLWLEMQRLLEEEAG